MGTARAASARRLGQILAQTRQPIFVLDTDDRIVYANSAWEPLTGRSALELIGLECVPAGPIVEGDADAEARALGSSLAPPAEARRGEPASVRTFIVDRQGQRHWRRIAFWPLEGASNRPGALLGLVHDADSQPLAPESPSDRLRAELAALRENARARAGTATFLGGGPAHVRLMAQVGLAAAGRTTAWIVAESGSGMRTVAALIHEHGQRANAPLIPLDAAALPPEKLEEALLGSSQSPPWQHLPPGATVLLMQADQIARDVQTRLARALGDPTMGPMPIRLLAASHEEPEAARAAGRLRDDLYYLMTGLMIPVPPLRARLEELPLLAQDFLDRAGISAVRRPRGFTDAAIETLRSYDWPGNLSELSRVVEAAARAATGELIDRVDLPMTIQGEWAAAYHPPPHAPVPWKTANLDATLELVESKLIEQALQFARHNKTRAAERLGISRPRLYRRMKELEIEDLPEGDGAESSV